MQSGGLRREVVPESQRLENRVAAAGEERNGKQGGQGKGTGSFVASLTIVPASLWCASTGPQRLRGELRAQ